VVFRALSFQHLVVYIYNKLKGHKYGGVYQFMKPGVLLREKKKKKMVTVKDFEHFMDRQPPTDEADPIFGKSLFNLKGEQFTARTVPFNAPQQTQMCFQNTVAQLASDQN
jgi:cytochrome P450 family 9